MASSVRPVFATAQTYQSSVVIPQPLYAGPKGSYRREHANVPSNELAQRFTYRYSHFL